MKPVAIAIIFRYKAKKVEIMTQLRLVKNKSYDPLYDRTHEAIGETLDKHETGWPKETFLAAAIRGIREECGRPDFEPVGVYGADMKLLEHCMVDTGKGDSYFACEPFCLVQSLGPPQPWFGPAFLVEAASDFEPDYANADGEADEHTWWAPLDLLAAMEADPSRFMGLHLEPLRLAATELS